MKLLPVITLDDICRAKPCYNPDRWLPPGQKEWAGTILDIFYDARIPERDRLWVLTKVDSSAPLKLIILFGNEICTLMEKIVWIDRKLKIDRKQYTQFLIFEWRYISGRNKSLLHSLIIEYCDLIYSICLANQELTGTTDDYDFTDAERRAARCEKKMVDLFIKVALNWLNN